MHLTNFVLALCLISAIHCARFKRDDTEVPAEPETEIEKEPSKPSPETGTGENKPTIPDFGAWFGQFYGSSGSENTDWIAEAQNFFQDPSKWDPSKWDTSKWVPKFPSK